MRSGESAESVAADTGWDLAKVLRYAEPLLDERAFMAQQGSSVEVRRSGGGATLAESCAEQLGAERADTVVWDSYRRGDGRWIITADVPPQGRAAWTYDHRGRNLHPLDDLARALMGAAPMATPLVTDDDIVAALDLATPVSVVRDAPVGRPHLVAVESVEETDADSDRSGSSDAGPGDDGAIDDATFDDAPHDDASAEGAGAAGAGADEHDRRASSTTYEQETITLQRDTPPRPEAPARRPEEDEPRPAGRKARGRKGRASIPSWDEILFGAGRNDD